MTRVIALGLTLLLGACASTKDPMMVEIEESRERRADSVEEVLDTQPDWYKKGCTQISEIACAMAVGESTSLQASEDIAMEIAKGKICDTAGGTVDKVSKTYRTIDGGDATINSRTSIRSVCDSVDVSGLLVGNKEVFALNDKYMTYVELKILLEGNSFRDRKQRAQVGASAEADADAMLEELDN
jgi:hypothetical protein